MKKHRNGKNAQIKAISICRGLKCRKTSQTIIITIILNWYVDSFHWMSQRSWTKVVTGTGLQI